MRGATQARFAKKHKKVISNLGPLSGDVIIKHVILNETTRNFQWPQKPNIELAEV